MEFHGKLGSGLFFIPIRWDCSEVLGFESEVTPKWQHLFFFFSQVLAKIFPIIGGNQTIDMLGGGFKYFSFSALFGEDVQFDQYFSDGLKPPTSM